MKFILMALASAFAGNPVPITNTSLSQAPILSINDTVSHYTIFSDNTTSDQFNTTFSELDQTKQPFGSLHECSSSTPVITKQFFGSILNPQKRFSLNLTCLFGNRFTQPSLPTQAFNTHDTKSMLTEFKSNFNTQAEILKSIQEVFHNIASGDDLLKALKTHEERIAQFSLVDKSLFCLIGLNLIFIIATPLFITIIYLTPPAKKAFKALSNFFRRRQAANQAPQAQ